jgi:hypothetical protein
MDRPCRQLAIPASEIFSGFDGDAAAWRAIAPSEAAADCVDEWKLFLSHCEALLKAGGIRTSRKSIEIVAVQIAMASNNSYRAGIRASAKLRAGSARAAKRRKADKRGRILQRAIVTVCAQQKLMPAASEKFALSIQAEVIEAAKQLGLGNAKSGTSTRSLQRQIAALLKHERMP